MNDGFLLIYSLTKAKRAYHGGSEGKKPSRISTRRIPSANCLDTCLDNASAWHQINEVGSTVFVWISVIFQVYEI
jgi:hypothetical protein